MKLIQLTTMSLTVSVLLGCSSITQRNHFKGINTALDRGDIISAAINAEKLAGPIDPKTGKTDNLLWTLEAGTLNYALDNNKRTIKLFDAAEKEFKQENNEGIITTTGENIASTIVNQSILDYKPTQFDMVYANYYKAMSFWKLHDLKSARIEFNRTAERQRRAAQYFSDEINTQKKLVTKTQHNQKIDYSKTMNAMNTKMASQINMTGSQWTPYKDYVNPAVTYSNALFFMLNGTSKSDYRKAVDGFKRVYGISKNAAVKNDLQMARGLVRGHSLSSYKPSIWLIHEDGLAPKKSEFRLDLPIFLVSSHVQTASIAFPRMNNGTPGINSISVDNFRTQKISDVSKIIKAEFKQKMPSIITKTIANTVTKILMQVVANQTSKKAGLLGSVIKLGTSIYTVASTSADIRTNTALPNSVGVTRIPKKEHFTIHAGQYQIPVQTDPKSKFTIIYVRTINALTQPVVSIINI